MQDIKKLLGKRVKELRLKKGLSQADLSAMADMSEKSLSRLECGNNFIRPENVKNLSEALEVTPQDLFNFEHHKDIGDIKEDLMNVLNGDEESIRLFYRIFKFFK